MISSLRCEMVGVCLSGFSQLRLRSRGWHWRPSVCSVMAGRSGQRWRRRGFPTRCSAVEARTTQPSVAVAQFRAMWPTGYCSPPPPCSFGRLSSSSSVDSVVAAINPPVPSKGSEPIEPSSTACSRSAAYPILPEWLSIDGCHPSAVSRDCTKMVRCLPLPRLALAAIDCGVAVRAIRTAISSFAPVVRRMPINSSRSRT